MLQWRSRYIYSFLFISDPHSTPKFFEDRGCVLPLFVFLQNADDNVINSRTIGWNLKIFVDLTFHGCRLSVGKLKTNEWIDQVIPISKNHNIRVMIKSGLWGLTAWFKILAPTLACREILCNLLSLWLGFLTCQMGGGIMTLPTSHSFYEDEISTCKFTWRNDWHIIKAL